MAIRFLINYGVRKITLAGFDGYSHNTSENYAEKTLQIFMNDAIMDAINVGMKKMLQEYGKLIELCRF